MLTFDFNLAGLGIYELYVARGMFVVYLTSSTALKHKEYWIINKYKGQGRLIAPVLYNN